MLRPLEFYALDQDDFWLMLAGWDKGIQRQERWIRKHAAIVAESFVGQGKGIKFVEAAWPLGPAKKQSDLTPQQEAFLKEQRENNAHRRVSKKRKKNG